MFKQETFVLTSDMVPIHIMERSCGFICPLPKGYKQALLSFPRQSLFAEVNQIAQRINSAANKRSGSFANIMLEYQDRNDKQRSELKKLMFIERVLIDDRGLYGAQAGTDVNSGDIYLDYNASPNCDLIIMNLDELFENDVAFQCHNVDFYWQALLCRELTVRYFNLLNKRLNELKKGP